MHIICMFLASLAICAPSKPYGTEYSRAESAKAFDKMVFCAGRTAGLPSEAKNTIYSRCLVALGATI